MTIRRSVGLLVLLALAAGCGPANGPPMTNDPTTSPVTSEPRGDGRLRGWATVLDDGTGPKLCLGGVMESLPPQCGGPQVVGWDWAGVGGVASAGGTRWGQYVVTGTYDGQRFTLTEPPVRMEDYDGPPRPDAGDVDLGTPCPEPDGGWRPVDPDRTSQETLDRVAAVANGLDGFADLWWDQSVNPAYDASDGENREHALNDPAKLVVNVRVVGDVAAAEAELREVWGGALCVTEAQRTAAELMRIQRELSGTPGMLTASSGRDVVDLGVEHDDGSLQRRLDEKYGEGVVRVHSALVPVNDLED